ncbi:MAG: TonB-dependent receptor [Bacteroidales bacterium]|nr:TonB-dependent receptor [Candidatus Cryptobacteroides aphodequi]
MKKLVLFLLSLSVAIASAVSASAQITTSAMEGTVSDDSGEALAGAVVTAVHTPTGSQYYAVANDKGHWAINGMRTGGPYEVVVSFIGMGELKYEGITLKLGDPYVIDAVMKASNELDAVVVVSESAFNASKTGAGASFSLQQVEHTPTINRSVFDIVKYTPQAVDSKQGGLSIAGASSRYNSFQIDGAVANDSFGLSSDGTNGAMVGANPISLDAVEEIQIVVAPFDVRQSGFTGGGINAITKSGTNQVKGTVYAHYYNQDFIGTTPGTTDYTDPMKVTSLKDSGDGKLGIRTKYEEQLNQTFGATVGAPIIKNKLFLFMNAEYHQVSSPNIYSPVNKSYELEARKFLTPIVLPDGSSHDYLDAAVAQAAIDHYINTYSVDGKDIFGKPVVEGFQPQQSHKTSINALARIDWNINDRNKFMFRYQLLDASSENIGAGYKTYYFENSNNAIVNRTHTLVGELNSRIGDNIHNELRATAVLVNEHREVPYALPTIYTNGDNTILDLGTHYCSYINKTTTNTYTLTDNLSIAAGDHSITIGTHNELYSFANAYRTYATGQYYYSTAADFFATGTDEFSVAMATAYPDLYSPGTNYFNQFAYNYADPTVSGVTGPDWYATTNALQLGFYAQDEWKPSRDFSLTYGIRADVPMLLNKPTCNELYNADAARYSTDPSEQVGVVPAPTVLWSPRVGFRWFITEDHKSLLRGGAGLFTGRVPFVWLSNAYNNTGMETKSISQSDKTVLATLPITTEPYKDIVEAGLIKGKNSGATLNTLSKNFKYPQVFRANLGFDQEFDGGWKLTLEGLFSKQFNNIYFRNIAIESKSSFYGAGAANTASAAPYYRPKTDDFKTIIALSNINEGYAYSVSGKVEKRFDFGLDLMASYTFGHSYNTNDGLSSQAASNLSTLKDVDINNPSLSYSIYDTPHKVNAIASYVSPIYGGIFRTSVSVAYTGMSGQRYSYTYQDISAADDLNGDAIAGNTLMYIPTTAEVSKMPFTSASDAAKFEKAIREDKYLSSHRGQWSERNAGIGAFENHFDLQVAQDFFYDKASKRKVQITLDMINFSNLINREWGLYYASTINRSLLNIDKLSTDADGNVLPTFSFKSDNAIYLSDFSSRWRCQLGVKLTF